MTSVSPTTETPSSSTLWATASQEWIIKPKPKPGRKPKTDSAAPQSETDQSCRKIQNRAAQRAFRERKQSQLAELQARLQSYEHGEIERNVAIQKIAKRLKDENDLLRQENGTLKARVTELEAKAGDFFAQEMLNQTNGLFGVDKKRGRAVTPPIGSQVKKKKRNDSMVEYPSTSLGLAPDNLQSLPFTRPSDFDSNGFNMGTSAFGAKADPTTLSFACDVCESRTACICHEIASRGATEQSIMTAFDVVNKEDSLAVPDLPVESNSEGPCTKSTTPSSILDDLPAYEPPVPLRRRNGVAPLNSIFPIEEAPSQFRNAICSGDPNDCLACAGDSFGQAFCVAIRSSSSICDCSAETISRCCGGSSNCLDCPSQSASIRGPNQSELMPTNDAWQSLKAHPNVQFADLTLLANVVASRSQCSGPQLIISGPPLDHSGLDATDMDPRNSPPPRLVPQDVLLECGRRRMRQVHADGVRDALRLLDAKFP